MAVAGSHFMLRARVMVLEERIKGYSEAMKRIFESLSRIEESWTGKRISDSSSIYQAIWNMRFFELISPSVVHYIEPVL